MCLSLPIQISSEIEGYLIIRILHIVILITFLAMNFTTPGQENRGYESPTFYLFLFSLLSTSHLFLHLPQSLPLSLTLSPEDTYWKELELLSVALIVPDSSLNTSSTFHSVNHCALHSIKYNMLDYTRAGNFKQP